MVCTPIIIGSKKMQVKKAIQKTKVFFHKTIKNLGLLRNREHQQLRRSSSLNLSFRNSALFTDEFTEKSEIYNTAKAMKGNSTIMLTKESNNEKNVHFESFNNNGKPTKEKEIKADKKNGSYRNDKGDPCSKIARGGDYVLARKMKELERMEKSDIDQVLDIEEVLHYYSCLTSPCYLDILDKFYIDMHSEFLLTHPSKIISTPSRRLGPLKI